MNLPQFATGLVVSHATAGWRDLCDPVDAIRIAFMRQVYVAPYF